jgi:hypothetical protein
MPAVEFIPVLLYSRWEYYMKLAREYLVTGAEVECPFLAQRR